MGVFTDFEKKVEDDLRFQILREKREKQAAIDQRNGHIAMIDRWATELDTELNDIKPIYDVDYRISDHGAYRQFTIRDKEVLLATVTMLIRLNLDDSLPSTPEIRVEIPKSPVNVGAKITCGSSAFAAGEICAHLVKWTVAKRQGKVSA